MADLDDRLEALHKGGGYYEIGDKTVRGKDKAAKALKKLDAADAPSDDEIEGKAAKSAGHARLRALKNIPPERLGREAGTGRVFKGEVFTVDAELGKRLVKRGQAQDAAADYPPKPKKTGVTFHN